MKNIKFRGKDSSGLWRYGYLVCLENNPAIYFQVGNGEVKRMDWVYVKPESVGQFTGLCDSKGSEIYEGDILKGEGTPPVKIVYNEKMGTLLRVLMDESSLSSVSQSDIYKNVEVIIGNVFDNPYKIDPVGIEIPDMTQEDKDLLINDLSSRLMYKPTVLYKEVANPNYEVEMKLSGYILEDLVNGEYVVLPFLRPMSSMADDEIIEYLCECDKDNDNALVTPHYHGTEWLVSHHFDFRGLIRKGLAITASKDKYNN